MTRPRILPKQNPSPSGEKRFDSLRENRKTGFLDNLSRNPLDFGGRVMTRPYRDFPYVYDIPSEGSPFIFTSFPRKNSCGIGKNIV